jgi:hypothetical protein
MNHSRKIELLRQIRYVLTQERNPSLRAADLSLQDVMELQKEKLLDLRVVDDSTVDELGNYRIHGLTDAGAALLEPAKAPSAPVLPAELQPENQPQPSKAPSVFAKRLGDLLKIAAGVAIGWYLKKYYG